MNGQHPATPQPSPAQGSNPGDRRRDELDIWPEWSRTCPGCGRYHNRFRDRSEGWTCSRCGWTGTLPVTKAAE